MRGEETGGEERERDLKRGRGEREREERISKV